MSEYMDAYMRAYNGPLGLAVRVNGSAIRSVLNGESYRDEDVCPHAKQTYRGGWVCSDCGKSVA